VRRGLGVAVAVLALAACTAGGQTAKIAIWDLPVRNTNLFDLCATESGVFVALPGTRTIAAVDPVTETVRMLAVGEAPVSLAWTDEGLFFSFYGGIGFVDPETGDTASWRIPGSVGKVRSLVDAEFTTDLVTLWFAQESPDKVGSFEPSSIPRATPDEEIPEPVALQADSADVAASLTPVEPSSYTLETPLLFRTVGSYQGNFAWWTPFVRSRGVDRLAVGAMTRLWFSQSGDTIFLLESFSDSIFRHSLASGTVATSVTVSPAGDVWYLDTAGRAACRLDPKTLEVTVWGLPAGGAPYDIAVGEADVWVSNRIAGAIDQLDPATGEIRRWSVGSGTKPSILGIDDAGSVWFIEEANRAIGRLTVTNP